jgi:hypothetical protein
MTRSSNLRLGPTRDNEAGEVLPAVPTLPPRLWYDGDRSIPNCHLTLDESGVFGIDSALNSSVTVGIVIVTRGEPCEPAKPFTDG